ncbi:glycosyltransferase family 2 protein [Candidatus Omnitrophota bacterium]
MNISIVIPAYNEAKNIKTTINELFTTLENLDPVQMRCLDTASVQDSFEIIVVDDHSSDDLFDVVQGMHDSRVKCLRLSKRSGSHIALRAGIKEAAGNIVLYISADGQDNPACLEDMLKKWRNGAKVVWAVRKDRHNEPFNTRKKAELFYKILAWLGGTGKTNIDISKADFCLLDKTAVNALNECTERNTSLLGLITWLGFSQDSVEYERRTRMSGKSKWSFKTHIGLAKDWLIGFSGSPLILMCITGLFILASGILYIALKVITNSPIESWSLVMLVVLVLGGIQMIMLGIIGEYLWRNLDESRKRPLFYIEKRS